MPQLTKTYADYWLESMKELLPRYNIELPLPTYRYEFDEALHLVWEQGDRTLTFCISGQEVGYKRSWTTKTSLYMRQGAATIEDICLLLWEWLLSSPSKEKVGNSDEEEKVCVS